MSRHWSQLRPTPAHPDCATSVPTKTVCWFVRAYILGIESGLRGILATNSSDVAFLTSEQTDHSMHNEVAGRPRTSVHDYLFSQSEARMLADVDPRPQPALVGTHHQIRRSKRQKDSLDLQLVGPVSSLISVLPTSCTTLGDKRRRVAWPVYISSDGLCTTKVSPKLDHNSVCDIPEKLHREPVSNTTNGTWLFIWTP